MTITIQAPARLTQAVNVFGYACNITAAFYTLLWFALLNFAPGLILREPNATILWFEIALFTFGLAFAVHKIARYGKALLN